MKMLHNFKVFGRSFYFITLCFLFCFSSVIIAQNAAFFGPNGLDRVRVTDDNPVNPSASPGAYQITGIAITLEAWIYPLNYFGSVIVQRPVWPQEDPWDVYGLWIHDDGSIHKPAFSISTGDAGTRVTAISPDELPTFQWTHLAGTYDGSNIRLYVNGVMKAETPTSITMGENTGAGNGFYVGMVAGNTFLGMIDDVRLWDISRNQTEIQSTMNTELVGNETGLSGYWKMEGAEEIPGYIVTRDETGNHNDLVVQGNPQWFFPFNPFSSYGTPDYSVNPSSLDFGVLEQGESAGRGITVTNLTSEPLVGYSLPEGTGVSGIPGGFFVESNATEDESVRLYLNSEGTGSISGDITLISNAASTEIIPFSATSLTLHRFDANNIAMHMQRNGIFAFNRLENKAGFEWPKDSDKTAIYSAGIWIAADVGGVLKTAVSYYDSEFSPGPIVNGSPVDPNDTQYRVYKIQTGDNGSNPDYAEWPGDMGAPVDEVGGPKVLGDQTLFAVYNDLGPDRRYELESNYMGAEVQQTTFGFDETSGSLSNTVFVKFRIINKSDETWKNTCVALWNDPDLGYHSDDLIGYDLDRHMGYVYNGDNEDENDPGYGFALPAVGFDFLKGMMASEPLQAFIYFLSDDGPGNGAQAYNYMQGYQMDGSPFIDPETGETRFTVSGDPVTGTGWLDVEEGDRRFLGSTGPFDMEPGQSREFIAALIVGDGGARLASITALRSASDDVQTQFDNGDIIEGVFDDIAYLELSSMGSNTLDDLSNSGARLDATAGTGGATVELFSFADAPGGIREMSSEGLYSMGKHIDVLSLGDVAWPINIRIYYTADDLTQAGITEEDLDGLFYWSGRDGGWKLYSDSGVDDQGRGTSTTAVHTGNTNIGGVDYEGYVSASAYHLGVIRIGGIGPYYGYTFVDVSNTSGVEDGGVTHPYSSITAAIAAAGDGDIIRVASGTYDENPEINSLTLELYGGYENGGWTRDIDANETIIDGGGRNSTLRLDGGNTVIDGFTIMNGQAPNHGGGGIDTHGGNYIIRNCKIHDNTGIGDDEWGAGGVLFGGGGYIEILNCEIFDNHSPYGAAALRVGDSHVSVKNSIISSNTGTRSLHIHSSTGEFINCTIVNHPSKAAGSNPGPIQFRNCILWNNGGGQWDDWATFAYSDVEEDVAGVGNIRSHPLFFDPGSGDYRLQIGSPCIDAGDPDPVYNDPDGSRNDMGAYGGPNGESYTYEDGPPFVENVDVWPSSIQPEFDVVITCHVWDAVSSVSSVGAEIETPDESVVETFVLYDDGSHGDGEAGDHIYGNSWTTPSGGEGTTYFVDIMASDGEGHNTIYNNVCQFIIEETVFNTALLSGSYLRTRDSNPNNPEANPAAYQISGTAITLEAWVYPLLFQGTEQVIVTRPLYPNYEDPWETYGLRVVEDGGVYKPVFRISSGDPGSRVEAMSPDSLPTFQWTHLAGTYDGSHVRLYVNGTMKIVEPASISIGDVGYGLYMGVFLDGWFYGAIDDVRLWNVVRTEGEIQAAMNGELTSVGPDLAGYWRMELTDVINDRYVTVDRTIHRNDLEIRENVQFIPFHPFAVYGTPTISVAPSSMDFGTLEQGNTAWHGYNVTNSSEEPLIGYALPSGSGVDGEPSAFFAEPSGMCDGDVSMQLIDSGTLSGDVTFVSNAAYTVDIPFTVNSIAVQRLDVNTISMWVQRNGRFAWNPFTGEAGLEWPKESGKTTIYASGIWIGADVGGQVRTAVASHNSEFGPGPAADPDLGNMKYRVYKIQTGDDASNPDYAEWPADLGAPVNADGSPKIIGDQTLFVVYNDLSEDRHFWGTPPLGCEVQQTSFAFDEPGALADVLFLRFKVINRSGDTWNNTYFALWSDPDLGYPWDDLVGVDTLRNMGFVYNGDDFDDEYVNVNPGYGTPPPAAGYDILKGAFFTKPFQAFTYYTNAGVFPYRDPHNAYEGYNFMQGLLADGTEYTDPTTGSPTTYALNGDPVTSTGWVDSEPDDRRFLHSTGPFTLEPGQSKELIAAIMVAQGSDRLNSVTELRVLSDTVQARFDNGYIFGGALENVTSIDLEPDGTGTLDDLENSGTQMDVTAGSEGATVELASYVEPPAGAEDISGPAVTGVGKYLDVQVEGEIEWPVEMRIYYTANDLAQAGVFSEDDLVGLYYWRGASSEWRLYSESGDDDQGRGPSTTGVNTENISIEGVSYEGYVWAMAYHLTAMRIGSAVINDPVVLIEALITFVEDLDLHHGTENSLISKLNNTLKSLQKGKTNAVVNQLNAFINDVEAQSGKKITEEDAENLILYAQSIIDLIQDGLGKRADELDQETDNLDVPKEFALHQNYPNPFNPETSILYELPEAGRVTLVVYNMMGQEVKRLVDADESAGYYQVVWDGRGNNGNRLGSGVYFIHFRARDHHSIRKLILIQ